MVKRGYNVIAAPKEGLENIHLSSVDSMSLEDSDVLSIGYLGVEIEYPYVHKKVRKQTQKENNLSEQVIDFVPTRAFQKLRMEYSQLDTNSSSEQSLQSVCALDHKDSVKETLALGSCQGKPIQVLLPKKAVNPLHWFQLDSTGSDNCSHSSVSIDADWSESSGEENSESEFSSYSDSEEEMAESNKNKVEEAPETRFIDMDDAAVHYGHDYVHSTVNCNAVGHSVEDCRRRIMKVQTLTDLNNENHYAKRQNTDSLNSMLSNVFENNLESKRSYKENNIMSSGNFSNGLSEGNLSSLKQIGCAKRTNSDDTVLDMQKYVIQKENIFNKNNYNIKSWNVKCFDCKTVKAHSKLDLSASSPESVTAYPLVDLYKKRQNVATKTNSNVVSLILCGCFHRKTKRAKKFQKTSRFAAAGFSLRK